MGDEIIEDIRCLYVVKQSKKEKRYQGMERRILQRKHMVEFWNLHRTECSTVRSIDQVFEIYKQYIEKKEKERDDNEKPIECINKYIFRTYIRKPQNGYKNSIAVSEEEKQARELGLRPVMIVPKKVKKKKKISS